jgi:hypothetical protein
LFDFLIIAAVAPALFLLIKVYKEDKLEKEPLALLLRLVLAGVISTLLGFALRTGRLMDTPAFFSGKRRFFTISCFILSSWACQKMARNISCSNTERGAPLTLTASLTASSTRLHSLGFALWGKHRLCLKLR